MIATAGNCNINVRTLRRWLQLPEFQAEINQKRSNLRHLISANLEIAADKAAHTLASQLTSPDIRAVNRAAKTILQITRTSAEVAELTKKVKALEALAETHAKQLDALLCIPPTKQTHAELS